MLDPTGRYPLDDHARTLAEAGWPRDYDARVGRVWHHTPDELAIYDERLPVYKHMRAFSAGYLQGDPIGCSWWLVLRTPGQTVGWCETEGEAWLIASILTAKAAIENRKDPTP